MGEALTRLAQKLGFDEVELARIPVPKHSRVVKGKRQDVDAHTREIDVSAAARSAAAGRLARNASNRPSGASGEPVRVSDIQKGDRVKAPGAKGGAQVVIDDVKRAPDGKKTWLHWKNADGSGQGNWYANDRMFITQRAKKS